MRLTCTICTAVAPDTVFTVRTYVDNRPRSGSALVRSPTQHNQQIRWSDSCMRHEPLDVSQVRAKHMAGLTDRAAATGHQWRQSEKRASSRGYGRTVGNLVVPPTALCHPELGDLSLLTTQAPVG